MSSVDLVPTADRILKIAVSEGAEQAEVFIESRENLVLRITKVGGKDNFTARDQLITGAAIRLIKGRALGFAYLSSLGDESARSSVRSALKVAEPQAGLESFHEKPGGFPKVTGILDKNTAEMSPEQVMKHLDAMRRSATSVDEKRITVYDALFGRSKHGFAVVNTQGLKVDDCGSFARMAMGISGSDGEKQAKMEVFRVYRSVRDVSVTEDFASKYARQIVKALATQNIETKKMAAVLSPAAVGELFTYSFANAFCGDNIQHKASPLEGKVNQQIASDAVTIVDDGTFEGGLASFRMDDEGMPTRRTVLVEKGVLKGYIHDNQTARMASSESTGNCVRWEMPTVDYFFYRSFRRLPRVFPTNLMFQPGTMRPDAMIQEVKDGIYIERTDPAFTATPDGSFSIAILNGFRIQNGELTTPARDIRITGNIFDYARRIDALANNPEKINPQLYPACVITPHIRVRDVNIQP